MKSVRIVGAGRAGLSFASALKEVGYPVEGPFGRDMALSGMARNTDVLLLAVPDRAIESVAGAIEPDEGAIVVHLSGATGLDVLYPHPNRASLHPLASLPDPDTGRERLLGGITFAVAGDPRVVEVAEMVGNLRGRAIHVDDASRVLYHAAGCVAANHLVALMSQVERIATAAGLDLAPFLDLAGFALDDVRHLGPAGALTGPAARGDAETLVRHLAALEPGEKDLYMAGLRLVDGLLGHTLELPGAALSSRAPASRYRGRHPVAGQVQVIKSAQELQPTLDRLRNEGLSIGLVPTMGALHAGHASLIDRASRECDVAVVTIFVNPLQFDDPSDLDSYPRDLDADIEIARSHGAGIVFAPSVGQMYPGYPANPAGVVHVSGISEVLEGASRPGHFDGVATVVAKLFALAGRCRAYFGEKDYQQVMVVRQMVRDLCFPVDVVACPTVRDYDGIALSSRNKRLSPEMRKVARCLYRALKAGERTAVSMGSPWTAPDLIISIRDAMIGEMSKEDGVSLDYAEVVRSDTFDLLHPSHPLVSIHTHAPPRFLTPTPPGMEMAVAGELRLLVAARVGSVRLIDNIGVKIPVAQAVGAVGTAGMVDVA
ncbi:MAG: pantoate--beta-alanine ligase [Actinobacteria bacterium]|nr:pantoate--beta-alanine ligase [Actinomycetota bacterium]